MFQGAYMDARADECRMSCVRCMWEVLSTTGV